MTALYSDIINMRGVKDKQSIFDKIIISIFKSNKTLMTIPQYLIHIVALTETDRIMREIDKIKI